MGDLSAQSLQPEADAALDRAERKPEALSDLLVGQLPVKGEDDHVSLGVGKLGEGAQEVVSTLGCDNLLVDDARGRDSLKVHCVGAMHGVRL